MTVPPCLRRCGLAALLLALLPTAASAAPAPTTAAVKAGGLRLTVSAVDPDVFHIVAVPSGRPAPPPSPFVVETGASRTAAFARTAQGVTVRTPDAALHVTPAGTFTLTATGNSGQTMIRSGQFSIAADTLTLALGHGPDQRLYGAGNAGMNVAGDLTHPSGQQTTGNGVTRIPFLWSTGGYGVLIANDQTGIGWSDTQGTLTWTVPGGDADVYLLVGHGGDAILRAYARLTGHAPIPPRWTFGFLMSRWGYADAADIQDKWQQFRDRRIPVDAFIYDYDWFVNDWQFNPKNFPPGSLAKMHRMGLHFVGIRKPRVNGDNLAFATDQAWILKSPQGTDLRFDLPQARWWWWDHQAPLMQAGVDGWWNDEAEQSYDEFFHMTQAEWDGQRALNTRRVWNINRAFAPGMQRFGAACWTGDITSHWTTLQNQPGTMLNWSLAGMPFVGQDIGGFFGPPTPELYARWMEEGVFVPVMRAHGMLNEPRWPWAFGDAAEHAAVGAIDLRYRLIPYLYTAAAATARTGAPMMRPLLLDYPHDPQYANVEDEWMLGPSLLAAPILTEGGSRTVLLPPGRWYDFASGAAETGGRALQITDASLDRMPAYVRAGSILPLGPVLRSTSLGVEDPLEVRVYPGANGAFDLYEDGGDDYSYLNGRSTTIPFRWDDRRRTLTVGRRLGAFPGMLRVRHLKIVLPDGQSRSVIYDGRPITVRF